jgi:hypothetical protein
VSLLIECVDGKHPGDLHKWLQPAGRRTAKGFVPRLYRLGLPRQFCSAMVERKSIGNLPGDIVKRFQLGLPKTASLRVHRERSGGSNFNPFGWDESDPANPDQVLLAVIDDDINPFQPTFLDSRGKSRFRVFWDQNTNFSHANEDPKFGYGLSPVDLNGAAPFRTASHGTHVASLAGGKETPQHRMRHSTSAIVNQGATDAASFTPMAGIVLPSRTVQDTSGGALAVNVFDALSFLADRRNTPEATHIVVNLSFGIMAGPHDGTSLLDAAMDEVLTLRRGKLTMVIPAGNSFEMQCHARFNLNPQEPKKLIWRVLPDDRTPSFAEVWLPTGSKAKISLQSPDGTCTLVSDTFEDMQPILNAAIGPFAGIFRSDNPANGDNGQLALLALSPTRAGANQTIAPHGDWRILVENVDSEQIEVKVWIERDNASYGRKTLGRQSYLVDPLAVRKPERKYFLDKSNTVTGFGSLNGIACDTTTVVVGGYDLRTLKAVVISAGGALDGSVRCPDGIAPSDESPMLPGLPGAAHSGGGTVRIGGTSVAAPLVSRFFVNELQVGRTIYRPPAQSQTPANGYDPILGTGPMVF